MEKLVLKSLMTLNIWEIVTALSAINLPAQIIHQWVVFHQQNLLLQKVRNLSPFTPKETELAFCKCCGSSLFSRKITGGKHNIRLGILDSTPTHKPSFHIFVASKAPWLEINDDLKQFEKSPVK